MARRSRSRLAFFLFFFLSLLACRNSPRSTDGLPTPEPFRAFYHWKTICVLEEQEQAFLDSLAVDRLYVKFFDLDWDAAAGTVVPLASVQLDTSGLGRLQVIPTLFITNRSMLQMTPTEIPRLARQIAEKIDRQFAVLDQPLKEVQLDCDWTKSSRDNYFELLHQLKAIFADRGVELSVTIRLHQLRYPEQTGVPPVQKGVLMFYNMGDLKNWKEPNSILNLKKAAAYLPAGLSYPLHLDLALPLFRWAVLFRKGQMIKLINEPDATHLQHTEKIQRIGPDRYLIVESTYLDGYYLYRGDQLRVESVSLTQLQAALALVEKRYPVATNSLIFYHLDQEVMSRYGAKDILRIGN